MVESLERKIFVLCLPAPEAQEHSYLADIICMTMSYCSKKLKKVIKGVQTRESLMSSALRLMTHTPRGSGSDLS